MSQGVGALDSLAVTRATLAYDQNEDRISLTCAFEKEKCIVLWLTARLANQLAPHLCRLVAQLPDAPSINVDQEVTDHGALASVEELESDATALADGAQERATKAPVVAEADSNVWLVTAIDLTNGPMLAQLSFRDDKGHAPVFLSLEHTQLAQWSEGLKRCYAQAGWPMDCWNMSTDAGPQSRRARRVSLH